MIHITSKGKTLCGKTVTDINNTVHLVESLVFRERYCAECQRKRDEIYAPKVLTIPSRMNSWKKNKRKN